MPIEPGLWGAGDAYERYMGRWSRRVAPRFVEWLGVAPGLAWIDIGCGTGILTGAILGQGEPSRVLGLDSAPGFLEVARSRLADPRVTFAQGDALALSGDTLAPPEAGGPSMLRSPGSC
jgi:ubiquinone/menaquinone biosynthesis C-methylase UbiE